MRIAGIPVRLWTVVTPVWRPTAFRVATAVTVLIALGIMLGARTWLPGVTPGESGTLWATFWATLLASLIVALLAGALLYLWQDSVARKREKDHAQRESMLLRQELLHELGMVQYPTWEHARNGIYGEYHGVANVLANRRWQHWRHLCPEEPAWREIAAFWGAYRAFIQEANGFDVAVNAYLSTRDIPGVLDKPDTRRALLATCIRMLAARSEEDKAFIRTHLRASADYVSQICDDAARFPPVMVAMKGFHVTMDELYEACPALLSSLNKARTAVEGTARPPAAWRSPNH